MKELKKLFSTCCILLSMLITTNLYANDIQKNEDSSNTKESTMNQNKSIVLFSLAKNGQRKGDYFNEENEGYALSLDSNKLLQFLAADHKTFSMAIPSGKRNQQPLIVNLYRSNILAQNAKGITSDSNSTIDLASLGKHYWGRIEGEQSMVAFSFYDDRVYGFVSGSSGNYNLLKLQDGDPTDYIFYKNISSKEGWECATEDPPVNNHDYRVVVDRDNQTFSTMDYPIELSLEANSEVYNTIGNGSVIQTINHLQSLFNISAMIFANEEVVIKIKEIFVETTEPTNYPGPGMVTNTVLCPGATSGYLTQFQNHRQNSYNGDYAYLFVKSTCFAAGVAATATNGYCNAPSSNRMAVSWTPQLPGSNYELPDIYSGITTFAHEMGHLFGSAHPNQCTWNGDDTQINTCGGNNGSCRITEEVQYPYIIMMGSFKDCTVFDINFRRGWGVQPGDRIRNNIIDNIECFPLEGEVNCQVPFLQIFHRIEDETPVNYSAFYKAIDITADNLITNSGDAIYQGESSVTLLPGFQVDLGSTFQATIAPCNEGKTIAASKINEDENDVGNKVTIYPNPTYGLITFKSNLRIESYAVLNIYGRVVKQSTIERKMAFTFDASDLDQGIYFINFKLVDGSVITKRMIKN